MKITDLLSKDAIKLNGIANSKQDAINKLVDLMAKNGNLTDKEKYTQSCRMSRHFASRFMREKKKAPQELEKELQYHMEKQMQFQNQDYQQW